MFKMFYGEETCCDMLLLLEKEQPHFQALISYLVHSVTNMLVKSLGISLDKNLFLSEL